MAKDSIVVLCTHAEHGINRAGGTIAKYAAEGRNVYTYIFSYKPFYSNISKETLNKKQIKNITKASKILGCNAEIIDMKSKKNQEELKKQINRMLKKHKPSKIFTYSRKDLRARHRILASSVKKAAETQGVPAIYSFCPWGFSKIKFDYQPKVFIDISETYQVKVKALEILDYFHIMKLAARTRAIISGMKSSTKYAEVFYKE